MPRVERRSARVRRTATLNLCTASGSRPSRVPGSWARISSYCSCSRALTRSRGDAVLPGDLRGGASRRSRPASPFLPSRTNSPTTAPSSSTVIWSTSSSERCVRTVSTSTSVRSLTTARSRSAISCGGLTGPAGCRECHLAGRPRAARPPTCSLRSRDVVGEKGRCGPDADPRCRGRSTERPGSWAKASRLESRWEDRMSDPRLVAEGSRVVPFLAVLGGPRARGERGRSTRLPLFSSRYGFQVPLRKRVT